MSITEPYDRRITRCSSCRAKIIWFKTKAGKMMPVDAASVDPADQELDLDRHISHFATCIHAIRHRRPR